MYRRRRTFARVPRKRPLNKEVVYISEAVTTAQVDTTIYTVGASATVNFAMDAQWNASALAGEGAWVLWWRREGDDIQSINLTSGAQLYEPSRAVLASGPLLSQGTPDVVQFRVAPKSKGRRMAEGDQLVFSIVGDNAASIGQFVGTCTVYALE